MEFSEEMDNFFKSLEDGTVFDGVSQEVWEIAKRIVENNKEVTNGL